MSDEIARLLDDPRTVLGVTVKITSGDGPSDKDGKASEESAEGGGAE